MEVFQVAFENQIKHYLLFAVKNFNLDRNVSAKITDGHFCVRDGDRNI